MQTRASISGKTAVTVILAHPVAVTVALAIQWTALTRSLMGRKEGWKGRAYAAPGTS